MADNEDTDMPEDGAPGPDPTVDETGGPDAGGADMEDIGDGGTEVASVDNSDELLAQEDPPEITRTARDLDAVYDIPVQLSAVLGRANMQVSQLLKLGRGAVVELDRKVGEAIDIYVNNRLVARGEVVVVEERLGITMTEIIKSDRTN